MLLLLLDMFEVRYGTVPTVVLYHVFLLHQSNPWYRTDEKSENIRNYQRKTIANPEYTENIT